jgi:hypothetical protein
MSLRIANVLHQHRPSPYRTGPLVAQCADIQEQKMNNTFPRTIREAFGHEGPSVEYWNSDRGDALVLWAVILGVVAMAALTVF